MILPCLLGLTSITLIISSVTTTPLSGHGQTELANTHSSTSNASIARPTSIISANSLSDVIDERLKTIYHIYPELPVNGTSLFMTVLKVMICLSFHEYKYPYAGGIFSFKGFTNLKLQIESTGASLQYRHAILGLYHSVRMMIESNRFMTLTSDLYWTESTGSVPNLVGDILITPDPLPVLAIEQNNQSLKIRRLVDREAVQTLPLLPLNGSYLTAIGSNLNTSTISSLDAQDFKLFVELQGTTLPLSAIFVTFYTALIRIASAAAQQPFTARYEKARTELIIKAYDESRAPPRTFRLEHVAQILEKLAKFMFDQRRFEGVVFVWEVAGVPVGQGELRAFGNGAVVGVEQE